MSYSRLVRNMVCAFAAVHLALPAVAGEEGGDETLALGEALFAQHCASCHGVAATGDGPLAPLLTVSVPDLTGLAARNDGVFPMLDVVHTIDGRAGRKAHGGPMPVWGVVFSDPPGFRLDDQGALLEARGRIMALTLWLESIQH